MYNVNSDRFDQMREKAKLSHHSMLSHDSSTIVKLTHTRILCKLTLNSLLQRSGPNPCSERTGEQTAVKELS